MKFDNKSILENFLKSHKELGSDRYNFLNLYTLTIDSNNTQRFDDAISLIKQDNGYILFVHITDIINDINYHQKNSKKIKNFLEYHGNNNYDSTNSLVQGIKRNTITLAAYYEEGVLKEYRFIKGTINVNSNLNLNKFEQKKNIKNITKEVCNQAKNICEFYKSLKVKIIKKNPNNTIQTNTLLLEEIISIYTHLLGRELMKKEIGREYHKILINNSSYLKKSFYVKATSPLYKGESYINQLIIHDFIFSDRVDTLEFWKENKEMIKEYLLNTKKKQSKCYCTKNKVKKKSKDPILLASSL